MVVDAGDTGVLLHLFLVNVASLKHEEEKLLKTRGLKALALSSYQRIQERLLVLYTSYRRLLMRRDYRPIIITLAHPENYGGSSYLLTSTAGI